MYFLYMFLSVLSIVILLLPGFFLKKTKTLSENAAKDLSAVLLFVGTPALAVYCMMGVDIQSVAPLNILICVLLAIAIHFIPYAFMKLFLLKADDKSAAVAATFGSMFSNCGFMGIPMATLAIAYCEKLALITEAATKEALFYVTIFNIVFNIITWTFGLGMYSRGEKLGYIMKKAFLSPVIIATLLSIPFFIAGFSLLNPIVIGQVEISQIGSIIMYLYNICVPISMIVLGIRLSDVTIGELVCNKYVYICGAAKLVITPLITIGIMWIIMQFMELSPALMIALTVMSAAPPAANGLAFAETYNGDTKTAGASVLLCTIISILTLPLFLLLVSAMI
ncbi:MAG: AEC family transporter [Clostridia bacterium]|nr:AEC family transporter [Clostridia bacterium]MBP5592860.1 AEC family transporter [Clostridia bacterium]MBP5648460.1 AEC family transporter [Clostridia bacterium]